MSKMVQLRNVPEPVHRTLKARAAREGMSLSDYLKRELERVAERPSLKEWLDRVGEADPIRTRRRASDAIRAARDTR
jgi:hypothetical protein